MCERDFTWHGWEICIFELMFVNLNKGSHKITLEKVGTSGTFELKNVLVNDEPADVTFTV
jgi:hypothetical protein